MNLAKDPVIRSASLQAACLAVMRGMLCMLVLIFSVGQARGGQPPEKPARDDVELADEGSSNEEPVDQGLDQKSGASQPQRDGPSLRLPASLPDGRPLRAIGLYESQMDELLPNHYQPVSIDRFTEAVTRLTDRSTDDQASRLKGAVYWVEIDGDTMVSDRSVIDIESDRHTEVRRSLGKVNLAIERSQNRGTASFIAPLPRLESELDGNLVAVFRGDAKVRSGIEFKWRLHGRVFGSGYEFELQLPRTPQTRIVLSAPPDVTIQSFDGVLRSRPGPPPDAGETVTDRELSWYELDAGGLSSVRIRTQKPRPTGEGENFVVRRTWMEYDADSSGLTWKSGMVVQLPENRQFPSLAVSGTTITAVKVNSSDVPFTRKTMGAGVQHVQIDVPSSALDTNAVSVNVTLTGQSTWTGKNGWWNLPMPVWIGEGILHASTVDDVKLFVIDPLQVMSWQLPGNWKQAPPQQVGEGITLYSADGPPVTLAKPKGSGSNGSSAAGRAWSRVRLIYRPTLKSSDTSLRLEVSSGSLIAKARIAVQVDPVRIEPLQLRVERGWSLTKVAFAHSGRVIETPNVRESLPALVLWPEDEDANESAEIVVEITGEKLLPAASAGPVIPATWFVRPQGVRGNLIAAIVPPADLNWSGDAAMQRSGINPMADLTDAEKEFFSGLDQDALWFEPETGRTPSVSLQTPSVSFNATTVFQIGRDRDEITESLEVEIESQGQRLKRLDVQTGPSEGRPDLTWSISGNNDSPSTSLPSSDIEKGEGETDGIYTIDVSDKNLRGRRLIARRRYTVGDRFELQLPSVPGAASQSSDAVVSPGLLVSQSGSAVQLVPLGSTHFRSTDSEVTGGVTRLRYDAVEQPAITLSRSDVNPNVTIVWREQVRVIASSRGTDRIEAMFKVSPAAPLAIAYDPELQLASVSRDGEPVDLITIPQRPSIILQPRSKTEWIRVVWNRSQFESGWMRRCRIPRITVSGTVLRSEYQLISSSDTFAPVALLRGQEIGVGRASSVVMRPGDNATLVRRNIALAIGWLIALMAFAVSWYVAERAPLVTAAMVVVMTAVVFLWWPWRLAVIGWMVVPIVAAAMLATSTAWSRHRSGLTSGEHDPRDSSSPVAADSSGDFSLGSALVRSLLLLVVSACATAAAMGQEASRTLPAKQAEHVRPVNVLVPVDKDGARSGEIIYIPGSVYSDLFPVVSGAKPKDARIESADYHVKINPTVMSDSVVRTAVEAEFLIHLEDGDRSANLVRLPLTSTTVRRIELIEDVSQIIQFKADGLGQVIATLPRGNAHRIRATLLPKVSESEDWSKIVLSIPPVASSRLTVEAEQTLDALRVGGAQGRLLSETDPRSWEEELGPVDSLEIDFRTLASANLSTSKPLKRRYWVHAGIEKVTIDCEVEPPHAIAIGETFQFVIRDSALPNVTSPGWRFDGSELYSTARARRLMTLTCTRAAPGPIRLLWSRKSELNHDQPDSMSIEIPEVIAAASGKNARAWIALHCDSALQFTAIDINHGDPLTVDNFLEKWSGYRGLIDRAYVLLDEMVSPVLRTKEFGETTVSQQHHLHVMPRRLELYYSATLTPSDATSDRRTLRIPRGMDLIRLSANDQELDSLPIQSGSSNKVSLGSFDGSEAVTIKAVAVQQLPKNGKFSPPRFHLLPAASTSDVYSISRDRSTVLSPVKPPTVEPVEPQQTATADSLAQGWIPVSSWSTQSEGDSEQIRAPGGSYKVKERPTRFAADQLIALTRDDGRWVMETLVRFKSKPLPDFVDIEVPTRWCESLEVGPTNAWSQQPGNDPSRQVIRVLRDKKIEGNTLFIRGQLEDAETVRVSVPSVRVLGFGPRQIHISVPSRLSSDDPIQWRTGAVEAAKLPPQWSGHVTDAQRSTYVVANPSWLIDLAPLPEIDAEAIAVNCDAQVFTQDDGALVMCHWDLFPGGFASVDVRLPSGATCLGAWSAGKAVVVESVDKSETVEQENVLRVPLSLSRLSQPVELLIRVPSTATKEASYLPELTDVPVMQKWLTHYVPTDSNPLPLDQYDIPGRDRAIALARSVVEAVEAVEMVDRRPRDEVAAWLELWLNRYRMIAQSAGHLVDLEPQTDVLDDDRTPLPSRASDAADQLSLPSHLQWRELDSRMALYADRFLAVIPSARQATSADGFHFGVAEFEGFVVDRVRRLSGGNRPHSFQPGLSNDRGLRNLIVNVLTLLVVCGLLVCLRPLERFAIPFTEHPAFWLALMGIFGFAVAPVAVAAAIILVAISLPVFPSRGRTLHGRVR